VSLRTTSARGRGRSVRGLHVPLPRVPAPDGQRVRDAGRVQGGSSGGHGSVRGLLPDLVRVRPEGARLPFLPGLRLAGLLHGADGARPGRRLRGLVRGPVLPRAGRVGLRLAQAPVGDPASDGRAACAGAVVARAPALPRGPLRGGSRRREGRARGALGVRQPLLQRRLLREPRRTDRGRARAPRACDRAVRCFRELARGDSDLDPIRGEPRFASIVES
jgi:hypothetical protein